MSVRDVYDGPIRAMLATYPQGIGTVSWEQLYARWHSAPDFRRSIDAARAEAVTDSAAELEALRAENLRLREAGYHLAIALTTIGHPARVQVDAGSGSRDRA